MSSPFVVRRGSLTALTVFATAVLFFVGFASGSASAAEVTKGSVIVTIPSGKAGKVSAISPAKVTRRFARKGAKVSTAARGGTFGEKVATGLQAAGGLKLANGKRSVKITGLKLAIDKRLAVVRGNVAGKKNIVIFTAAGKGTLGADPAIAKFTGGKLKFPPSVAKVVKNRLKLKKAPTGKLGTLFVNASKTETDPCVVNPDADGCPVTDPYLAECGVSATSKTVGSLPVAAPLPVLSGGKPTVSPDAIHWGVRSDFRAYVIFGANGSLKVVDGASTVGGPPVISSFSFPATGGEYAINNAMNSGDDQLVLNGSGTALFCATGHEFRVAISNPTLVIDGENSRIIADVDSNLTGVWTPTQRIDLASLDLDGITPAYNKSGTEVTWGDVPASLTDAGAKSICGTGEQTACSYVEGTPLDDINVSVATAYDTGAGDAAAWDALATYVQTNHPFPNPDPTTGGCEVGVPTQTEVPTAGNARTVDEHLALAVAPTTAWSATPNQPATVPALEGTTVTGGDFDWGFRRSLRSSINGSGQFNVAGGATASNPAYFGNGGSLPSVPAMGAGYSSGMALAGEYFTWPASSGTYKANGVGEADDQLVLRTEGTVAFCQIQSAQRYGIIFANPTVIIDGANSRITIDVMTRYRLSWIKATVDFASLDLSDPGVTVVPTTDSGVVTTTWTFPDNDPDGSGPLTGDSSVVLTPDGEKMARMLSPNTYVAGANLDGATIRASFPE